MSSPIPPVQFGRARRGLIAGCVLALTAAAVSGYFIYNPPGAGPVAGGRFIPSAPVPAAAPADSSVPPVPSTASNWRVADFRVVPPATSWSPEPASPSPYGESGFSLVHPKGDYTAVMDHRGISLSLGESSQAAPFRMEWESPDGSPGSPARVRENRVEIERGTVTEWFRNSPEGIEQGFTVRNEPADRKDGEIRLEFNVAPPWRVIPDAGSTSVRFRDEESGSELRYQNLLAHDATGRRLPARLEPQEDGGGLTIHTSAAGAVYPVTVDPLFTVVTVAGVSPGSDLWLWDVEPALRGNELYFNLFNASDKSSYGLWSVNINDVSDAFKIQVSDVIYLFTGTLSGPAGDSLLFSSDSGTKSLYSIPQGKKKIEVVKSGAGGGRFVAVENGVGYYLGSNGFWKTDGTEAGTVQARSLEAAPWNDGVMLGEKLLYRSREDGGSRLLFSTPDSFGTLLGLTSGLSLKEARTVNGKVLFSSGGGISVTDGTVAGTATLTSGASMAEAVQLADAVYFPKGGRLWRTDGTVAGTAMVSETVPVSGPIIVNNGALYFHGLEGAVSKVWRSDGTPAGTVLFRESAKVASAGENLFYLLVTTSTEGEELWVSNGTPEGTTLLKDITPGSASTAYDSFRHAGNHLLFRAGAKLWRSSGSAAGTLPLFDIQPPREYKLYGIKSLTPAGHKVFFSAYTKDHGQELWCADSDTGLISEMRDIRPGGDSSDLYLLKALGDGSILFFLTKADSGTELWRSDGTPNGTMLVKNLSPFTGRKPADLIIVEGTGWFFSPDENGNNALFRTDGTSAGTVRVHTAVSWQQTFPRKLCDFRGGVAFLAPADNAAADRLFVWASDGTAAGTSPVLGFEFKKSAFDPVNQLLTGGGKIYLLGLSLDNNYTLWCGSGDPLSFVPLHKGKSPDDLIMNNFVKKWFFSKNWNMETDIPSGERTGQIRELLLRCSPPNLCCCRPPVMSFSRRPFIRRLPILV